MFCILIKFSFVSQFAKIFNNALFTKTEKLCKIKLRKFEHEEKSKVKKAIENFGE